MMRSLAVRYSLAAVLLAGSVAHAEGIAYKSGATFGFGYTFGGSNITTLHYVDGQTQNIKGGGTYLFKLGGEVRLRDYPIDIQATVGYHVDNDHASNAEVRYTRWPLEAMVYYRLPTSGFRVGAGLRYVTNTNFSYVFEGTKYADFNFDKNFGYVVEGEYFFFKTASFSIRYVKEPLSIRSAGERYKAKGDHMGLLMHVYY